MSAATTRIAVMVEPGKPFELRDVPLPDPGPGELLVEVAQANICGSDLHMWRGEIVPELLRDVVLGHEFVGRVVAAGPGADRDSAGRPVGEGDGVAFRYFFPCGRCPACTRGHANHCPGSLASVLRPASQPPHVVGGFAGHYLVTAGQSRFRLPEGLAPEVAAGANCALAQVVHALDVAGLRAGEAVAVQGCGGLGLYAIAVAKGRGADPVIALDLHRARLELAERFGADHAVSAADVGDPRQRTQAVLDLTGGWGADIVVEVVGRASVIPEGLRMLAIGGRYLELGSIVPRDEARVDASMLVGGNRSILGVALYPDWALLEALRFLARGQAPFEELVGATFALDEIDAAFEAAEHLGREGVSVARVGIRPGR